MKTILVPTDYSAEAENAFLFAIEIAEKWNAEILLLHIADLPVVADPMGTNLHAFLSPDTLSAMEEKISKQLILFSEKVETTVSVKTVFEWGNPYSGIASNIASKEVDLVVMGSKGASGAREIFVGSNAERVIRNSPVPVITIKNPASASSIKKVVFGTDLSAKCNSVIDELKTYIELFNAELHIVRVNTPVSFECDFDILPELTEFADSLNMKNVKTHIYNDLNEDLGLIRFSDSINADMIALSTHGKRGIEHFISGSIAEDTVNHAKRPIWTCVIGKKDT